MKAKIRNESGDGKASVAERTEERQIRFLRERNDAAIRLARENGRRASSRFFLGEMKDDEDLTPLQSFARHLVDNLGEDRARHIADGIDEQVVRGISEFVIFSGEAFQIYLDTDIAEGQSVGSDIAVSIGARRAKMLTKEIRSRIADMENRHGKLKDDPGTPHIVASDNSIDDEVAVARKPLLIWQRLSNISEVNIPRIAMILIPVAVIALSVYFYASPNNNSNDIRAMNQSDSPEVTSNDDLGDMAAANHDSPAGASDDDLDNVTPVNQPDSLEVTSNDDLDNLTAVDQSDSPAVASDDDLDNVTPVNQSDSLEVASNDGLDNIRNAEQSDDSKPFSIQLGAFKDRGNAKDAYNEFVHKGYPARIEYPALTAEGWHRVLVGRFHAEQDAMSYAEKVHEQEGIAYMIVRSPIR